MKKLLKAFTLAEVLITLGIIGVVARVSLPTLTTNVQMQTTATSLAKAINTLESVNEKMKLDKNTKTLSRACINPADRLSSTNYLQTLPDYLDGTYRLKRIEINGSASGAVIPTFTTKDGIMIILNSENSIEARNAPAKYNGRYNNFLIDTNGDKKPNKFGKDQFVVWIDNYGAVIPLGGAQHAEYTGSNSIAWETLCASSKNQKPIRADRCTGSIVDNGYKILYAYNSL